MCVCHRCDVRSCIELTHLFLGTKGDNNADMVRKRRNSAAYGEANSHAKLTLAEVQAIRADARKRSAIIAEYGISSAQLCKIKNGQSWGAQ